METQQQHGSKGRQKMELISMHMPPQLLETINEIARKEGMARSELIRSAIYAWLINYKRNRIRSIRTLGARAGLGFFIICRNCRYELGELLINDGISVDEKAELIKKIGMSCPKCGSQDLEIIIKPRGHKA